MPGATCPAARWSPVLGETSPVLFSRREAAAGLCEEASAGPMLLPAWEMCLYGVLTVGSHFYAFYEAHQVSQSKPGMWARSLLRRSLPLVPEVPGLTPLWFVVYFALLQGTPLLLLLAKQPPARKQQPGAS